MVDGSAFGVFLDQLSQAGFFSYVLPFLVIFALVYGILLRTKLFEQNKAIDGIIALAVGLMALQFDFVPRFFSEIFPRLGIALAVILVLIILLGLFFPANIAFINYALLIVGVIIFLIVLTKSGLFVGSGFDSWWSQYGTMAISIGVVILVLIVVFVASRENPKPFEKPITAFTKALMGNSNN